MTPKSDNHRFFIGAQNRGSGVRWASLRSSTVSRLRHFSTVLTLIPSSRLSAAVVACDRCIVALIACVHGRGAAVTYLSHNDSFHSKEQIAPSNRGIKHLALSKLKAHHRRISVQLAKRHLQNALNTRVFKLLSGCRLWTRLI